MLDRQMALKAIDFVVGHVRLVQEDVIVDPFEIIFPVMANGTSFVRDTAIATGQVTMTIRAIDTPRI